MYFYKMYNSPPSISANVKLCNKLMETRFSIELHSKHMPRFNKVGCLHMQFFLRRRHLQFDKRDASTKKISRIPTLSQRLTLDGRHSRLNKPSVLSSKENKPLWSQQPLKSPNSSICTLPIVARRIMRLVCSEVVAFGNFGLFINNFLF